MIKKLLQYTIIGAMSFASNISIVLADEAPHEYVCLSPGFQPACGVECSKHFYPRPARGSLDNRFCDMPNPCYCELQ